MSHLKERKEKVCLNCNADVHGRFCHVCGQENVETIETAWHLVTHFVYDITHFDGKFFSTVKYLLTKPGFLSLEYSKGRRMSYLNPIKMYVFTSAFFFIFFFSFIATDDSIHIKEKKKKYTVEKAKEAIQDKEETIQEALQQPNLNAGTKALLHSRLADLNKDKERLTFDTTNLKTLNVYNNVDMNLMGSNKTKEQYDSTQKALPKNKQDGWFAKKFHYKKYEAFEKYGHDNRAMLNALIHKFIHFFPQVLFISLPIFAFLLKLLYRRKRDLYYSDHAIYTIHLYCAMFILIFVAIVLAKVEDYAYFKWVGYVIFALFIYIFWYIYKSLRNYYSQSRKKTILKFLLLMFISSFVMSLLFMVFFVFSAFTI